ncbi:helicase-related protein [Pokkaliibacter plantistimulans]|uniref:helicase-related protein n=1 Tax=Pokkaliibacter plantistimulans TaxID=1635171 RepID=UPI000D74DBF1|nr:helicase-related protein [Pokkaliibacter plantistimulans]
MSLPIITADQRLAERRGVKGVLVGKSGIGKTSQLWTLKPTATLFFDLEAGDLAVEGWAGDTIRPRTWQECRDFAVYIGGPNPALRDDQPFSQAHFDAVIRHWRENAGERKTIVFCSTVAHAECVRQAFQDAGVSAVIVHGELSDAERKARLAEYESGAAQVVVNVAVLTEGYDFTPTSCVVLLRPSSHKSTLTQMIGRGLRTIDPAEHPVVIKTDCVVLDFGTATLMHGSLEQDVNLDGHQHHGEAPTKDCPSCEATIPLGCRECPLCGFVWENETTEDGDALADFVMTEIDLLKRSNFRWCDLFGCDDALMATGFNAWGGVFFLNGRWHAVGGGKDLQPRLLAVGDRTVCMAKADDWLNDRESADSAHKTRRWLNEPPTAKQLQYLPQALRADFGMTRYQASALLSFQFNKSSIQRLVVAANDAHREAA